MDLEAIAAAQDGLVTRRQAIEAGASVADLRRWVRQGRWVRDGSEVFRVAGSPESPRQRMRSALLLAGDDAFVSHATAAAVHGVEGFAIGEQVELTVPITHSARLGSGVVAHRSRTILERDLREVEGLLVASPARIVVDLSGRLDQGALGELLDHFLRRGAVHLGQVRDAMDRAKRAPGRSAMAVEAVLSQRWPGYDPGESPLETRVLRLIASAGLPLPRTQWWVELGGERYRLDLAYPEQKVAVECDGFQWHGQRTEFDRDRRRQNRLVAAGWRVVRITAAMSDAEIVATISAVCAARDHGRS